jgi:hypothetical protein
MIPFLPWNIAAKYLSKHRGGRRLYWSTTQHNAGRFYSHCRPGHWSPHSRVSTAAESHRRLLAWMTEV